MSENRDVTRREVVKMAGGATAMAAAAKLQGAPAIHKVRAQNNVVNYAIIGMGGRGSYLLRHFNGLDGGRCVAVCDIRDEAMNAAIESSK